MYVCAHTCKYLKCLQNENQNFFSPHCSLYFLKCAKILHRRDDLFEQTEYKHLAEIPYKMCFLFEINGLKFVIACVDQWTFLLANLTQIQDNLINQLILFPFEEESLSFIWQVSSCGDAWVRTAWKMGFIVEIVADHYLQCRSCGSGLFCNKSFSIRHNVAIYCITK